MKSVRISQTLASNAVQWWRDKHATTTASLQRIDCIEV